VMNYFLVGYPGRFLVLSVNDLRVGGAVQIERKLL